MAGFALVSVPVLAWDRHQASAMAAQPLPDDVGRDACAVWFVGSSSMRNWSKLQSDMEPWTTHNRSISGASLSELVQRFANGRSSHPPQAIVFYAGENDIAFGVPADRVAQEFEGFMRLKRQRLGTVPVIFVSVKPSPTRWDHFAAQTSYNGAVAKLADAYPDLTFVDTVPQFLRNGRPGPYYMEDGIHLTDAGYRIWAAAVREHLRTDLPRPVVNRCDAALF